MLFKQVSVCVTSFVFLASIAHGAIVQEFTDFEQWQAELESSTTMDFTDGEFSEYIGDDYADSHGLTFTNAYYWSTTSYVNDGQGFRSNVFHPEGAGAWIDFDTPQFGIAVHHSGDIAFELSYQDKIIFTSDGHMGGPGVNFFSGLVTTQPFDRVYLHRQHPWDDEAISVDDLHFGTIAPAPGALGAFALAALCGCSRRRKRE